MARHRGAKSHTSSTKWSSRPMHKDRTRGFNARLRQADEDYVRRMAARAQREAEIKAKLTE